MIIQKTAMTQITPQETAMKSTNNLAYILIHHMKREEDNKKRID